MPTTVLLLYRYVKCSSVKLLSRIICACMYYSPGALTVVLHRDNMYIAYVPTVGLRVVLHLYVLKQLCIVNADTAQSASVYDKLQDAYWHETGVLFEKRNSKVGENKSSKQIRYMCVTACGRSGL